MYRTTSAMFCIDWSAMSCRFTVLTDCGVSRRGVSVLVAKLDRVVV